MLLAQRRILAFYSIFNRSRLPVVFAMMMANDGQPAPSPIVIAYHLVWTAYGWWLPNDPRGSMSQAIACDVIAELGELHQGRKRIQPSSREIRDFYQRAASALKFPLLSMNKREVIEVALAFSQAIECERYTCYACAVMPDHVHILIRKHKDPAEQMIQNLQDTSRLRLRKSQLRVVDHPIWGGPGWKVFLDHPDEIRRTIRYIEENPKKARLPSQKWAFVKEYDGWPLHPGHSRNSPYVKRLKGHR